jgi:hypothetical protein
VLYGRLTCYEFINFAKVIFNPTYLEMFYAAYDGTTSSIGYAVSLDGVNWTKIGKVGSLPDNVGVFGVLKVSPPVKNSLVFAGEEVPTPGRSGNPILGYSSSVPVSL